MSTFLGQLYESHHRLRRNAGDFVFVPERIPVFQEAVGQGHRVLDLGCRSGALTRHFLNGNDVVVAGELLEHVRFPRALVAEVRRVLRLGGVFVGSVPNAFRVQNRLRFVRGLQPDKDPTHLHMFTPTDIRALLADFTGVRITPLGGRYRRLHARLLAQDIAFSAIRKA